MSMNDKPKQSDEGKETAPCFGLGFVFPFLPNSQQIILLIISI